MKTNFLTTTTLVCLLAASAAASVGYRNSDPARPQPTYDRPIGEEYDGRLDELSPVVTEIDPIEFSARIGLHDWDGSHDRTGIGTELALRMGHHSTPLDLVLDFHYADADYKYETGMGEDANMYRTAKAIQPGIERIDAEGWTCGGSLLLQWNLARWALVNPFFAGGVLFEKSSFTDSNYVMTSTGPEERPGKNKFVMKDDGAAVVARAGVEYRPEPFYVRADVSWISDVYGNDAQFRLSGTIGVEATDDVRAELTGHYFTEWDEYYALIGFTLLR
jgi:hypothetical protein